MNPWSRATHYGTVVVVGWDYGTYGYGTMGRWDDFVGDNGTMGRHSAPRHPCAHRNATVVQELGEYTQSQPSRLRHLLNRTTRHALRPRAPLLRLLAMQFGIEAVLSQQFAVTSLFFDYAIFENHDFMTTHGH
jgi:hypothetical protein